MENRINVAELLRECPEGMELDCLLFDGVVFDEIDDDEYCGCPIVIKTKEGETWNLTNTGCWDDSPSAKCVIFPKGKTTWEGFVPPFKFKDGDILFVKARYDWVFIYKENEDKEDLYKYAAIPTYSDRANQLVYDSIPLCCRKDTTKVRFATEEEIAKLFNALKDCGFKWNAKTKTLEKFIDPKFKIGDKVRHKNNPNVIFTITGIEDDCYINRAGKMAFQFSDQDNYELVPVEPKFKVGDRITNGKTYITIGYIDNEYYYEVGRNIANRLFIKNQDEWNLVSNKFDITRLKPFDKVLVRDKNTEEWRAHFFSHYRNTSDRPYICIGIEGLNEFKKCIPFKGNEHLRGKTDDCNDFYKIW